MKRKILVIILCAVILYSPNSFSQVDNAKFQELRTRVAKYESNLNYKEAIIYQSSLIDIINRSYGENSYELAEALEKLADLYGAEKKYDEAKRLYKDSLNIFNKKPKRYMSQEINQQLLKKLSAMDDINIAMVLLKLGMASNELSELGEAKQALEQAKGILDKEIVSLDYARNSTAIPILGRVLDELGTISLKQNNTNEAKVFYKKAILTVEKYLGEDHPTVIEYKKHFNNIK